MRKGETSIAIKPSLLARHLCRMCVACVEDDPKRQTPLLCSSVQTFINRLKQEQYGKEHDTA